MINAATLNKLQSIPEKDWGIIYKNLILYAHHKLQKFNFEVRTEKDSVDPEYFCSLAIEKIFDGTRAWDYDRFPDILIHLKGVIKSLVSSHFKSSSKSIIKANVNVLNEKEVDSESDIYLSENMDLPLYDDDPEEILISQETWTEIEKSFEKDSDGFLLFSDFLDGNAPRDIAAAYNLEVKDVYNAIRNGKRKVKLLFNKR